MQQGDSRGIKISGRLKVRKYNIRPRCSRGKPGKNKQSSNNCSNNNKENNNNSYNNNNNGSKNNNIKKIIIKTSGEEKIEK